MATLHLTGKRNVLADDKLTFNHDASVESILDFQFEISVCQSIDENSTHKSRYYKLSLNFMEASILMTRMASALTCVLDDKKTLLEGERQDKKLPYEILQNLADCWKKEASEFVASRCFIWLDDKATLD